MVNNVPENWRNSDELEMLFFFYQVTDELLSETTADTYALPLHNTITLVNEIAETYYYLKRYNCLDKYYANYIPPIMDELFYKIEYDYLLKKLLGNRLESILTGFKEAKSNYVLLERWINLFIQTCSVREYRAMYQNEIINLITKTSDKDKLLYCVQNYYISLINVGYSREYIYTISKKYFHNRSVIISRLNQIEGFFDKFDCKVREYNFLVLMDMDNIDYLDSINSDIKFGKDIQKIDVDKERKTLCQDYMVSDLIKEYDRMIRDCGKYQKIAIVKISDTDLDPYKTAIKFSDYISFLQTFKRYFIHHNFKRQVYRFLLQKEDGTYVKLEIPKKLNKRAYIGQELIDSRVENILSAKSMSPDAFHSLAKALEMHADAFDSKNTITLFRSLWTALETLFLNPNANSTSDAAMSGVLSIIQKTYLLKVLRGVFSQIKDAIDQMNLKLLGITDFISFVEYFSMYNENSDEMKRIYNLLSNNPLLRSRLYKARKQLQSGEYIGKYIDNHSQRIEWQLKRLYRIRNIATHLGTEISGSDIAINHLHNYFDYAVNYMLCKSENNDYVIDVPSLVFESKNDIRIHRELLKENQELSINNYQKYLFGPDIRIINYKFE